MIVLIFSRDSRYSVVNETLIDSLEKLIDRGTITLDREKESVLKWVSPALLILDVFIQPLLIDRSGMNKALEELQKLSKIYVDTCGDPQDVLVHEDFCEMIRETILSDIPLTQEEKAREEGLKALRSEYESVVSSCSLSTEDHAESIRKFNDFSSNISSLYDDPKKNVRDI